MNLETQGNDRSGLSGRARKNFDILIENAKSQMLDEVTNLSRRVANGLPLTPRDREVAKALEASARAIYGKTKDKSWIEVAHSIRASGQNYRCKTAPKPSQE